MRGVLEQLAFSETTARQFAGSEFLVRFGVRGDGETVTSATKKKLHRGRRLVRAALKLATQLLNTGSLQVGVASRLSGVGAVSDAFW